MNLNDEKYNRYDLVKEMLETSEVVKNFDPSCAEPFAKNIEGAKGLFLTGEGSSRIFPAKRAITEAMKSGFPLPLLTEGGTQAMEYDLSDQAVFAASNSGKTKEVVRLFTKLKAASHSKCFGISAHAGSTLGNLSSESLVLKCGNENAVAATKSVAEQALVYQALLSNMQNKPLTGLLSAAKGITKALEMDINPEWVESIANSPVIYFAGRNNGVAEELTLKTNEITRKKSEFLEGTYAVHGIEEVMGSDEVVLLIDPFEEEEEKFTEVLAQGVGLKIIAISDRETSFPTIRIPNVPEFNEYVQLAAGWNVLVEVGINLGIDLDKPVRARKVGNEFVG